MSQADLTNDPGGIYEEKPRSNIYTAMLGISFLAMAFAAALLAMELKAYDYDFAAKSAQGLSPATTGPSAP